MQTLMINELDCVSGGITETQCVGYTALVGGFIGGAISAYGTGGWGTSGGWGLGFAAGGAIGGMFCAPALEYLKSA